MRLSRQAAASFCLQWCWFNCTCCIIINFINDTETEFIWITLLNMSHCTANPKQNLQNDLCPLGRLRSDYTVRVVWSVSLLKKPWVLDRHWAPEWTLTRLHRGAGWSAFLLGLRIFVVGPRPAARAPQAPALVTFAVLLFIMQSRYLIYHIRYLI